jgi:Na+/H+-dicarboxylate symporter
VTVSPDGGARLGAGRLAVAVAVAAALGFAAGFWVGPPMERAAIVGELFLLALRTAIAPFVFVSLVGGVAALAGRGEARRAAAVLAVYGLVTMGAAVVLGISLVTAIGPGRGAPVEGAAAVPAVVAATAEGGTWAAIEAMFRSTVAPNALGALAADPPAILAIIVAAIVFALAAVAVGEPARPVLEVMRSAERVFERVLHWVVLAAPVGVFTLIAARIGSRGGGDAVLDELRTLGLYVATVVAGLVLHGGVVLPTVLVVFGMRKPLPFARGMLPALLTAFSTASSSATMPVTLDRLERANGVSPAATRFVVPLGATLNMNGTALYEAVAVVFIAQRYGIELGPQQLVLVAVTATLAAIGASGIPEAGLVTMVMVLQAVGLPLEGIGLLLAVDWFLDRCRTTVNVWDDAVGSAVVERVALRGGS